MLFGRAKECFITCRDRTDGGGAQIAAQISTMIHARLKGIHYAHTPLTNVAHAPEGISPEEWSAAWESFFSLGEGEREAAELTHLEEYRLEKPHRQRPKGGKLNVVAHCHKLTDQHPERWAEISGTLREKYALAPKPELPDYNPTDRNIAIHLRRGDVAVDGRFSERFTHIDYILPVMKELVEALGSWARIHVYSQGKAEDFVELEEFNPVLHLDEDVFQTFHGMAMADVLLTAKSTFSYLAGVIGTGQVIYEPFWHPALPGWHTIQDEPEKIAHQIAVILDQMNGE